MPLVSSKLNQTSNELVPEFMSDRKTVDIFADSAKPGEEKTIDATEDAFKPLEMPEAGLYDLQLFPSDDTNFGITENENDRTHNFSHYTIPIVARIVNNEEFESVVVFPRVSTYVSKRRNTCTAVGLLVKLGYSKHIKPKMSDLQIARLFVQVLKQKQPIIKGNYIDWRASFESKPGKWENPYKKMEDFPVVNGERLTTITVTTRDGDQKEIKAQLFVREWGGVTLGETVKPVEQKAKPNGAMKPQVKQVVALPEAEVEDEDDSDAELD